MRGAIAAWVAMPVAAQSFGWAAQAQADLLAVAAGPPYDTARYYRVSTDDASVELVASASTPSMFELTLGPDGRHYAVSDGAFALYRVDPATGAAEQLHHFGDSVPAGGLAVSAEGIAYSSYWGASSGTGLWRWNIHDETFEPNVSFSDWLVVPAAQFRDDGTLVAALQDDPRLHSINLHTGDVTPIGELGDEVGQVWSLARETGTGRTFLLAGEFPGPMTLHEIDLFTLETTEIGPLPHNLTITGISGMAPCAADFNADGSLDILDFVALQQAFQDGDEAADINGDGRLDVLDFVAFQDLFKEGCA